MYEELVKRLRDISNSDSNIKSNYIGLTMIQAADAIEELICEVATEHNERLDAEERQRWIPVTGEPPLEVGDDGYNGYLVYVNGYYAIADYAKDKYDNVPYFHVDGEIEPDVTHYIPLPPPPKEET
jgi:hypothetical protein